MDDSLGGLTLKRKAGNPLHGLRAPVGPHIGKQLRTVGQQVQQEHRYAVQRIVLRCEGNGLTNPVPVERGVEHRLREVAVRTEIGPLPLSLKSSDNGIVAHGLLFESHLGKFRIALHQVPENQGHLDHVGPNVILLAAGILQMFGIAIHAFPAHTILAHPVHRTIELVLIVDSQFDTALDLRAIDKLVTHTQILLEEIGIRSRSGNTHRHRADRQIRFAPHLHDGNGRTAET